MKRSSRANAMTEELSQAGSSRAMRRKSTSPLLVKILQARRQRAWKYQKDPKSIVPLCSLLSLLSCSIQRLMSRIPDSSTPPRPRPSDQDIVSGPRSWRSSLESYTILHRGNTDRSVVAEHGREDKRCPQHNSPAAVGVDQQRAEHDLVVDGPAVRMG